LISVESVSISAQANPEVVADETVNTYPSVVATVNATGVEPVLAEIKEPLAVRIALSIKLDVSGATKSQAAPS